MVSIGKIRSNRGGSHSAWVKIGNKTFQNKSIGYNIQALNKGYEFGVNNAAKRYSNTLARITNSIPSDAFHLSLLGNSTSSYQVYIACCPPGNYPGGNCLLNGGDFCCPYIICTDLNTYGPCPLTANSPQTPSDGELDYLYVNGPVLDYDKGAVNGYFYATNSNGQTSSTKTSLPTASSCCKNNDCKNLICPPNYNRSSNLEKKCNKN
jgi:hypothetical protein